MEKASEIEVRRQKEIQRKKAEEEYKRRLHEQAVSRAKDELVGYARLIKEAEQYLEEYSIRAEKRTFRDLCKQVESDPHSVAREASSCRESLETELEEAKKKAEKKKEEVWLRQKSLEAAAKVMVYQNKLEKAIQDTSWLFYNLRLRSLANPNLEQFVCKSLNVQSLDEAESMIKQMYIVGYKDRLKKELNGNPYSWCTSYIKA